MGKVFIKEENYLLSKEYNEFLNEILALVQRHRVIAIQSVQSVSNTLYWNIGELIIHKQRLYGWGKSVVERLSVDLQANVGYGVSWSSRNLWFMRQLVDAYTKVKQPVSELEKVKQLVSEIPWGQNILIVQRIKDHQARLFYLRSTAENRYSRSVLLHQIMSDAYSNYILHPTQHNFAKTLNENLLEQTQESIKSVYSLDFLDINKPVTERNLENSMVEKVRRLIMELGYGFCFIGNQYKVTLGNKDYYIDLLFYHRILKCLVAVELKVVEFEPEFVGKLDFYLQIIDDQLKQDDDHPSIGILLVPHKDHLEVEYALKTASKPIGVSKYKLCKKLPENLTGKLPGKKDFQILLSHKSEEK